MKTQDEQGAATALDCCAGAGGLSLGLQSAGFSVRGVELDPAAVETHRALVGPCDLASLWDYTAPQRFDLVAGGIPCQSHSMAGKRGGTADERGQLYIPFLRIAKEAGARAILIENVRGLRTSPSRSHGTALAEILDAVRGAGFEHSTHTVLDAADFGVPQRRHRLFIVAFRDLKDWQRFAWPAPTHAKEPGPTLKPWRTVREALGLPRGVDYAHGRLPQAKGRSLQGMRALDVDAPAPAPAVGGTVAELLDQPARTVGAGGADTGGAEPFANASYRRRLSEELSALDEPAPTVTATEDKSASRFGSCGARTDPRRCGDQLNPLLSDLARAGVLDRPSTTVDADPRLSSAGHHKSNAVRLSIPQLAALQSFPEGFSFAGKKRDQHKQVGNAVPPPLAHAVGRAVLSALSPPRASERRRGFGAALDDATDSAPAIDPRLADVAR